jgi:hypothetical protein
MSNLMRDDYFSFMSNKWGNKGGNPRERIVAPVALSLLPSDTINFEDETQIEVTESFVSDTTIQRIFKRWSKG